MTAADRASRLLGLIGLAQRAGKLAVGATAVKQMVARGGRPVLILARDAASGQLDRMRRLEPVTAVVDDVVSREELATALGRDDLVVVAVEDRGFAHGICRIASGS